MESIRKDQQGRSVAFEYVVSRKITSELPIILTSIIPESKRDIRCQRSFSDTSRRPHATKQNTPKKLRSLERNVGYIDFLKRAKQCSTCTKLNATTTSTTTHAFTLTNYDGSLSRSQERF